MVVGASGEVGGPVTWVLLCWCGEATGGHLWCCWAVGKQRGYQRVSHDPRPSSSSLLSVCCGGGDGGRGRGLRQRLSQWLESRAEHRFLGFEIDGGGGRGD